MARIATLTPEAMTAEQAAACAEVASGPRGKVPMPMQAWLRSPELSRRIQKLGEVLRFELVIGPRLTELAILVCARHWTAHVQWRAHKAYALRDGLDPAVVDAIAARRTPSFGADEAGRAVHDYCVAMLTSGRVSEPLYRRAHEQLGERGLVELAALLGYYCLSSFTLNTFELGLPENAAPELEDPAFPPASPAA